MESDALNRFSLLSRNHSDFFDCNSTLIAFKNSVRLFSEDIFVSFIVHNSYMYRYLEGKRFTINLVLQIDN